MTERDLEKKCIRHARQQGFACWKNEKNGNKGIPDFSLLSPDGIFIMVEFKRPDGLGIISAWQRLWADRYPGVIYFIDSFVTFQLIIERIKAK